MGGTAFYPNQPCSLTTCSILCNICGTKYNDLNKNGVQDVGEPGLAGWTIQLYYWNGPLYAATTTDGSGNYCFNNIPCGAWTVNEADAGELGADFSIAKYALLLHGNWNHDQQRQLRQHQLRFAGYLLL